MKKVLSILLVVIMVMGVSSGVVFADDVLPEDPDFEMEYMAAPAVAGLLLEEAGIDNRYGKGKDGGNYIKDVAAHMGPGTDFEFPEGNVVSKTDVAAYKKAIALFLRAKGLDVGSDLFTAEVASVVLFDVNDDDCFGHVGDVLTISFTNEIYASVETDKDAKIGVEAYFDYSINPGIYSWGGVTDMVISGCDVIFTVITPGFVLPRPVVGANLDELVNLEDAIGNDVIIPGGMVLVTE